MNTLKFGNGEWYGKKDTILAYNDLNSNYKPLPFNFSRASKATIVNKDGLIEEVGSGQPRVDYKDDSKGALLLEPSRTNLVTYSENFENYFNISEINLNPNYAVSPDGTLNANKVTFPSASRSMYKNSLSFSGTHSVSFWYKGEGSNIGKTFNVRLAVGATDENIKVTLESGWKRFEAQNNGLQVIEITNRNNTTIGTGSLLLYGFQIEQGSYSTSYIPTSGSAVTRVAEIQSANNIFSPTISIGANEDFAIYYEGSFNEFGDMLLGGGQVGSSPTSKSYLWILNSTTIRITGDGEVLMATCSPELLTNTNYKILVKRNGNVIDFFINGVKLNTTQGTPNTSFTIRSLGWSYSYSIYTTSGKIKNIKTYNTSLTDAQAIALTQV